MNGQNDISKDTRSTKGVSGAISSDTNASTSSKSKKKPLLTRVTKIEHNNNQVIMTDSEGKTHVFDAQSIKVTLLNNDPEDLRFYKRLLIGKFTVLVIAGYLISIVIATLASLAAQQKIVLWIPLMLISLFVMPFSTLNYIRHNPLLRKGKGVILSVLLIIAALIMMLSILAVCVSASN
jgi:hypothetical protein